MNGVLLLSALAVFLLLASSFVLVLYGTGMLLQEKQAKHSPLNCKSMRNVATTAILATSRCPTGSGDASGFTILLHSLSKNHRLPPAGAVFTQVTFETNTLLFLDLLLLPAFPAVCPRCQQQCYLMLLFFSVVFLIKEGMTIQQ